MDFNKYITYYKHKYEYVPENFQEIGSGWRLIVLAVSNRILQLVKKRILLVQQ